MLESDRSLLIDGRCDGVGGYRAILCLVATYALAAASYRYIEMPFLAMRDRPRRYGANIPRATSAA